jgi:hypothetical protein
MPNVPSRSDASASAAASASQPSLADFYPLKDVPKRVPHRPNGKRLHPKVAVRWALQGSHGVRLRYVAAGRQKLTCDPWVLEFFAAVAARQQQAGGGVAAAAPPPAGNEHRPRSAGSARPDARRKLTLDRLAAAGMRR